MDQYWQRIATRIRVANKVKVNSKMTRQQVINFNIELSAKVVDMIVKDDSVAQAFPGVLSPSGKSKSHIGFVSKSIQEKKAILAASQKRVEQHFEIDIKTLNRLIYEKKVPSHDRIKNLLSLYVFDKLYSKAIVSFSRKGKRNTSQSKELILKTDQFKMTSWEVYYYHYDESNKEGRLGLAVLSVSDKLNVYLRNVKHETATDFKGKIKLERSKQHITFNLLSVGTQEKHLRITVFVGAGKAHPLLLGIYTNIYSNNSLVAGTIILKQTTEEKAMSTEPTTFPFSDASTYGIETSILAFLENRGQNFIKTPPVLGSEGLKKWLGDKRRKV